MRLRRPPGEALLHLLQRLARLPPARLDQQAVADVFPELAVFAQVQNDRRLLARLVDEIAHALHRRSRAQSRFIDIRNCALLGTFSSRPLSSSTASTGFMSLSTRRRRYVSSISLGSSSSSSRR